MFAVCVGSVSALRLPPPETLEPTALNGPGGVLFVRNTVCQYCRGLVTCRLPLCTITGAMGFFQRFIYRFSVYGQVTQRVAYVTAVGTS